MKLSQGFVWLLVLIIVGLVVVGGGAYMWYTQGPQETLVPQGQTQAQSSQQPDDASMQSQRHIESIRDDEIWAVQSEHSGILAAPYGNKEWQFDVSGRFSMIQDSYQIDFGDGAKKDLECTASSSSEPVCTNFRPIVHKYAAGGTYTVSVVSNTRAAGTNTLHTVLTTKVAVE